jgi:hypothetical protein
MQALLHSTVKRRLHDRDFDNYACFIANLFALYLCETGKLDLHCHLGTRIRSAEPAIRRLYRSIQTAVHQYLSGLPQAAYNKFPKNLLKNPKFARNRCATTQYLDRNPLILLETNSAEIKRFGPAEHFSASS